jgi:putative hemolysin
MFPAGEVSSYKDGKLMVDKPWEEGAIKVIRKAQVPVVPIYFTLEIVGYFIFFQNQWHLSYCKITIRSFSQKRRVIKVRIGKPISVANKMNIKQQSFIQFLRKKTYMLANPYDKNLNYLPPHFKNSPEAPKEMRYSVT